MSDWVWIPLAASYVVHDRQIARHGGAPGTRDPALLEMGCTRAMNRASYEDVDVFAIAAAYAYGLAKAHAFVDGNKRTAFFVASDFLDQNGYELQAAVDQEHADMMVELAQGKMTRADAAAHLRSYSIKTSAT